MWTELLENSTAIESIFKEKIPELSNVIIKNIEFDYNGPTARVHMDLNTFPERPPKKWLLEGYNRISLTLLLIGLHDAKLTKWSTDNICNMVIEKSDKEKIVIINGDCELEVKCGWIDIDKISGYIYTN